MMDQVAIRAGIKALREWVHLTQEHLTEIVKIKAWDSIYQLKRK